MTTIAGLVGTILAAAGILNYLTGFLTILASLLPPVAGVIIADYWIVGKGNKVAFSAVKGINIPGLLSYIIGAAVAYLTANVWVFFVAPVNGIIVSMLAYLLLDRLIPGKVTVEGSGSPIES